MKARRTPVFEVFFFFFGEINLLVWVFTRKADLSPARGRKAKTAAGKTKAYKPHKAIFNGNKTNKQKNAVCRHKIGAVREFFYGIQLFSVFFF